jgi:hypothetical protein
MSIPAESSACLTGKAAGFEFYMRTILVQRNHAPAI